MKILPRILGLGLLGLLVGLLLISCEATKGGADEYGTPSRLLTSTVAKPASQKIAQVTDSATVFKTPQSQLAAAFIQQFGDGTVIDKILVRKAPVGPQETPVVYLVGMGQLNGNFRAMAVPLTSGGDNTYYLSATASRYVLTGVGCPACFFDFEDGRIVGTTCAENASGSRCDLKTIASNDMFSSR